MAKQKEPRKLTEKEAARVERVNGITSELAEKGYERKDVIISIVTANIMAVVLSIPFIVLFGIPFFLCSPGLTVRFLTVAESLLLLPVSLALIVAHEGLHGLTWGLCAPNRFKTIEFGYMKESMTPYCTCGEPLTRGAYILGSIMPCIVLGFIPSLIAVFTGSWFLFIIGILMIMGAGGDLTVILKMLTYCMDGKEVIIMDHPSECGFIVFERAKQ